MCGRFTITETDAALLAEELGVPVESLPADYRPRYNLAPTDPHIILRIKEETRELLPARWGLVNSWAKDNKGAARQINARAETIATTPAFREAYAKRRCVVPADGFHEWEHVGKAKKPFRFTRKDGQLLLFAGLYESWQPQPGEWQRTFTIVTTAANGVVGQLHDRMPVILEDRDADRWMFRTTPDAELRGLLRPAADTVLRVDAVSDRVNSVKNDDPSLLEVVMPPTRLL
ncbi:MAG: SOS response-associated peptidase [Dehalococcoidia bacterium]